MSRYRVKWTDTAGTHYGTCIERSIFNKDTYKNVPKGVAVVEDSIVPTLQLVREANLVDLPMDFGGEYDKHIEAEYQRAKAVSDKCRGVSAGSMFSLSVADGKAFYVVTKVRKTTCDVEWRGFGGGDRYTDRWLGWARRSVPLSDIKPYVEGERALAKLFGKPDQWEPLSRIA